MGGVRSRDRIQNPALLRPSPGPYHSMSLPLAFEKPQVAGPTLGRGAYSGASIESFGDTGDTRDTGDTGDTRDTMDTRDTRDTRDTSSTRDTGDTMDLRTLGH